ncbi:cyclic nucleotide-binding domain-containing protein [Actinomadura litoris]|uniref:Cyclic nucleotide-binding domain-containing protein n=1 Tax=Actinomadura litoris TaxID=2678616 RepID=A0A7K1KTI6_9ACTN|nr:cyclic nucleotide-binding domain-containing protein [Actinomadura litoris]MUN35463.1 cyclic nucleotide-binding domain-containing protein [Actinomadura litoris]
MADREHRHDPDQIVPTVFGMSGDHPQPPTPTRHASSEGAPPEHDAADTAGEHGSVQGSVQGSAEGLAPSVPPAEVAGSGDADRTRGFWRALTSAERDALLLSAREVVFPVGGVLWEEGDVADHVLVILSGPVRICVERDGGERIIAFRGPGDIVGERAALLLRLRSATVVAMDDVRALRMSTQEFAGYLTDHPRVLAVLEHEMYKRMTERPTLEPLLSPGGYMSPYETGTQPSPYGTATHPSPYGTPTHPVTNPHDTSRPPWGVPAQRYASEPPVLGHPHAAHPPIACPYAWHLHASLNRYAGIPPYQHDQNGHSMMAHVPEGHAPMALTRRAGGAPRRGTAASPSWAGQNCTIVFTDIAGFSDVVHRDDPARLEMRGWMYGFLRQAFEESHVPWTMCHREDRGDGALIIVPPDTPTTAVIDPMVARLAALLNGHNRRSSRAVRMQLRLALNVGPVVQDEEGVSGWALIQTSRLLDAQILKDRLEETGADLGFIASSFVYESVIAHHRHMNAAEYELVRCRVKQTDVQGWMHMLGAPVQPAH